MRLDQNYHLQTQAIKGLETVDTGKAGIDTCEDDDIDTNEDVDTVDCERSIFSIHPFRG